MRSSFLITLTWLSLMFGITGCGGSSRSAGSGSGSNVAGIIVDAGPAGGNVNEVFATVTVCVPGSTTNCNTIDHVLVDTGSEGLRLVSSTGGGQLTLSLPQATDNSGSPLTECAEFVSNVSYGSVRLANIQISGESASDVPIQVIGDTSPVPSSCSGMLQDTVAALGGNGILGVGPFPNDCGTGCLGSVPVNQNPVIYYSCPASECARLGRCPGSTLPIRFPRSRKAQRGKSAPR